MALPLNPTDVFKIFRDRGIRKRESVATYVETVARVATSLAETWANIYQCHQDDSYVFPQLIHYTEATEHYKRASRVLGNDLSTAQKNELFNALGKLLYTRNETKRAFRVTDSDAVWVIPFMLDTPERTERLEEIRKMIETMHEEAAILRALAAEIRAQV